MPVNQIVQNYGLVSRLNELSYAMAAYIAGASDD